MNIGAKIKELRERKGYSPEKLARYSDVASSYIRQIELGQRKSITIATASKLAKGLGVKVSDLVDDGDIPPEDSKPVSAILEDLIKRVKELENRG